MGLFDNTARELKWNYLRLQTNAFFQHRSKRSSMHGALFLRISYHDPERPEIYCQVDRDEILKTITPTDELPIACIYFGIGENLTQNPPQKQFHTPIELFTKRDIDEFIYQLPSIWASRKN